MSIPKAIGLQQDAKREFEGYLSSNRSLTTVRGLPNPLVLGTELANRGADLVIVPTQGSHLDAEQSARSIKLVRTQEKAFGRKIPFAILFTRTSVAIRTGTFQSIEDEFASRDIPMLKSHIHERSLSSNLLLLEYLVSTAIVCCHGAPIASGSVHPASSDSDGG